METFYIDTVTNQKKNTKPVIQDANCFVCVLCTKWQAFKNMLTAFCTALTSKWRVEHSLFIQPRWACQLQLLLLLFFFFLVLFIINFLKSLCFLLCCQLCASLKSFSLCPLLYLWSSLCLSIKKMRWGTDVQLHLYGARKESCRLSS